MLPAGRSSQLSAYALGPQDTQEHPSGFHGGFGAASIAMADAPVTVRTDPPFLRHCIHLGDRFKPCGLGGRQQDLQEDSEQVSRLRRKRPRGVPKTAFQE